MTAFLKSLPRNEMIAEFSLWSANLLRLEDDLKRIAPHCDILHVDVADGHFAPAMLFFPDQIAAVKKVSKLPIHVHLMVADKILIEQINQFAEAGADLISIHAENANAVEALSHIKSKGIATGLVLKWDTSVSAVATFIDDINFLTLLGTAIGVKGQSLSAHAPARLQEAKALIGARDIILAADGGIRDNTVPLLRAAGAQTVVLGSLAFGAPDLGEKIKWLKAL
ncbi:MAG: ribulose-phosphate 3-epimerase [Aestuariivirga sp.]